MVSFIPLSFLCTWESFSLFFFPIIPAKYQPTSLGFFSRRERLLICMSLCFFISLVLIIFFARLNSFCIFFCLRGVIAGFKKKGVQNVTNQADGKGVPDLLAHYPGMRRFYNMETADERDCVHLCYISYPQLALPCSRIDGLLILYILL